MNLIFIFHLSHLSNKGPNLVCVLEDLSDPAADIIDIVIHDIETVDTDNTEHICI